MRYLFFAVFVLVSVASASADDDIHPIDKWFNQKIEKATSTIEQREVYGEAHKRWDAELNKEYAAVQAKLEPKARDKLKVAQRAWIAWRDKELSVQESVLSSGPSGTLALIVQDQLWLSITRQRALDLKDYEDLLNTPP